MPSRFEIEIALTGYRSLKALKDKKLLGPLEEMRSAHAARDRFCILYRVDARNKLVSVLLVGERAPGQDADIYALAQKLLATFLNDVAEE